MSGRWEGGRRWGRPRRLAGVERDVGHDSALAVKGTQRVVKRRGVAQEYAQAAYEDALHYLLQEQKVPKNIDALAFRVKGDLDRRRLARLVERGFDTPTGFVLPLEWNGREWQSSLWETRRERLILIPGDSPMGLRLPLGDLPALTEEELPPDRDPFEPKPELAPRVAYADGDWPAVLGQTVSPQVAESAVKPPAGTALKKTTELRPLVRTAPCNKAREGKRHASPPPPYALEPDAARLAVRGERGDGAGARARPGGGARAPPRLPGRSC